MPQPETALGSYIRSRRKALGMTIADLAKKSEYSVGYISRLELGQADGPSPAALERLALALDCDLTMLVRLRDESQQLIQMPPGTKTDLEMQMMTKFRSSDDRIQRYLIEQAQIGQMLVESANSAPDAKRLLERIKPASLPDSEANGGASLISHDALSLDSHLLELASLYEEIGHDLLTLRRYAEAIEAYTNAENIFQRYENRGALARVHFLIGRTHRLKELQLFDAPAENVRCLHTADYYFARADQEFQQVGESNLTDAQRERYPENLADWARVIGRIGYWTVTTSNDLTPEDQDYIRRSSQERAQSKIAEAKRISEHWIDELEQRLTQDANHSSHELKQRRQDHTEELIAEAYHRMAVIYQSDALLLQATADESLSRLGNTQEAQKRKDDSETAFEKSQEYFRKALSVRQSLILTAATPDEKAFRLDRLANTHQNLGWTIQHCCNDAQQYEKAAWQYAIAQRLNQLNKSYASQLPFSYLQNLIDSLSADVSPDLDAVMQKMIEDRLTPERLQSLEYEREFPPKQPQSVPPRPTAAEKKDIFRQTDKLTGLSDRATFLRQLSYMFSLASKRQEPLSLVLIDIDYLKRYNKHYGYSAGDIVLKHLSRILISHVAESDLVARTNGDEFAVILPKTTYESSQMFSERLRQSITNELTSTEKSPLSVSIGIASLKPSLTNVTDLLEAAGQALHAAKRVAALSLDLLMTNLDAPMSGSTIEL